MTNKRCHALILTSLMAGSGLTPISNAEAAEIESLVVTAHRIPVAQARAAGSVTVLDRQIIDRRQTTFATDLLRTMPSVAVNRTAGFGSQTQVRIRGAEANHVLVVIDGVEANDPAGPDEFDFASLTAYDIESIEVLRGPQSALWGSDATAGVINIRTRQTNQPLHLAGFAQGGSFGTFHGGARGAWQGTNGGLNLTASHYTTSGTKTAANGSERDAAENTTVSLRGNWAPTDVTGVSVFARYTDGTTQFDDFDFATGLPADADRESHDELLLLGGATSISTLSGRWDHLLRATYLASDHAGTADGLPSGTRAADKLGLYYQSSFDLGATLDAHQLVVAVDHEQTDFSQRGTASPFGDPNQDQELRNTGFVAEYLGQFAELAVSASVRYDDNSDFKDITTYRLTGAYRFPQTGTRLRASWGTGHKSPTFVERFGLFADQFVGNPDLKPEKSEGFEIALEQSWLEGRVHGALTYFNEELRNEIDGFVFDLDSFALTAENIDGKSQREGVELEIRATINDKLGATLAYSYVDATQPDGVNGRIREIRRPKHEASASLNLTVLNERGNINLVVSHTGKQTDNFFEPPFFTQQEVGLGSYTLVNLAASYALTSNITLIGRVENLLNDNYSNVFGFAAPGVGAYAGIRMGL